MLLKGWSLDHLCESTSGTFVNMKIPRHHLVELESLGWGQRVTPNSLGDFSATAAILILLNKLNYAHFYF